MTIVVKLGETPAEVEAAKKKLQKKGKRVVLADFYGKMKGTFGDGLTFQKMLRDEWD